MAGLLELRLFAARLAAPSSWSLPPAAGAAAECLRRDWAAPSARAGGGPSLGAEASPPPRRPRPHHRHNALPSPPPPPHLPPSPTPPLGSNNGTLSLSIVFVFVFFLSSFSLSLSFRSRFRFRSIVNIGSPHRTGQGAAGDRGAEVVARQVPDANCKSWVRAWLLYFRQAPGGGGTLIPNTSPSSQAQPSEIQGGRRDRRHREELRRHSANHHRGHLSIQ